MAGRQGRSTDSTNSPQLRVLTQNLWGIRGAWDKRRAVISRLIHQAQPDLISFQEAIKTTSYDQVRDLVPPDYHVVYQKTPEPDGQSAAIASRWPIRAVHELEQRVTPRVDSANTTLVAEIEAPEPFGVILVVNHAPSWQLDYVLERELQASKGARFVEELIGDRDLHVIVAGDLTDPPESSSVRLWTGRQSLNGVGVSYRDAWESANPGDPGETYTPRNAILADADWPFRRLDYIMVRCGPHGGPTLAIKSCRLFFDHTIDGVWASDHFGVIADLGLPSRPLPPAPNMTADGKSAAG
jgi:endonuclease/exonuclease/phosphatase family metal-dependent hydrolase